MPHDPASPVVLVTGAARRVGAAIAQRLHGAGARLMLHYHQSRKEAEALAERLNAQRPDSVAIAPAALDDLSSLEALVAQTLERFGRLDGLVNNASSYFRTPMGSITETAWDDLTGSNLKGPLFLSQAAAPALHQSGGSIVNITDIHAAQPEKGYAAYTAAKAGLLGLTRALAVDLAPQVRVNAVAPGPVEWPDNEQGFTPSVRHAIINSTLLKRVGTPDDIARTVQFLLFDAPYITGQVIHVDGGRSAHLSLPEASEAP
ncbi:MAG TPA: pteridine reductase [Rhodocyclaceae bacterium]|nr:pteridine reductase [Rhodocyclaceae bacterium]